MLGHSGCCRELAMELQHRDLEGVVSDTNTSDLGCISGHESLMQVLLLQ